MSELTARDLTMFAKIGVSPELLTKAEIERVNDQQARERLALNGAHGDMGGIYFPYLSLLTGNRVTARVRRDNPEVLDGKPKNKVHVRVRRPAPRLHRARKPRAARRCRCADRAP